MATEVTIRYRFEDDLTEEAAGFVLELLEFGAYQKLPYTCTDVALLEWEADV